MLAGDVTSIWLDEELFFAADRPVDLAMKRSAEGTSMTVTAPDTSWIRFKSAKPAACLLNGREEISRYDQGTGMVWTQVNAGKTEIVAC